MDRLTSAERKRLPPHLAKLFATLDRGITRAPAPFEWLPEVLSGRKAVLESIAMDGCESWFVRWNHPWMDALLTNCAGCDADPHGTPWTGGISVRTHRPLPRSVPPALRWMRRTFGTWSLGPIQSGTAPFGRTLAEIVAHERASRDASEPYRRVVAHELEQVMSRVLQRLAPPPAALAAHAAQARSAQDDVDERFTRMPRGSADWVSLYEVDGDWILADIERNETVWLGGEWTGDRITRFDLPWTRAAAFVLWRVLDGGYVRPTDLQMLAR